jgi:hypothetical protein
MTISNKTKKLKKRKLKINKKLTRNHSPHKNNSKDKVKKNHLKKVKLVKNLLKKNNQDQWKI